ncbi:MAG: hypothetical protein AAB352_03240 [Patescibacteria group bacterium]
MEQEIKKVSWITSYKLEDGRLAEMLYDPIKEETSFIVGINDKTEILEKLELKDGKLNLFPLKADSSLLKVGFIKFPSALGKYNTNLELFEEIKAHIQKYSILPNNFTTIAALYVMMTWVYQKFHVLPYLRVVGMHGTGKTRFLETVGNLCYQALFVGGSASTASIFRAIDTFKGSLIFDEADFRNSELWSEIVKILNSGHTNDFPVTRMEVDPAGNFMIKPFFVFGPKILASRIRFGDEALESRCLSQNLLPHHTEISAPTHLTEEFKKEALTIRNKLLAFRFLNYNNPVLQEQTLSGINFPRLKQSILAIVNIAKLIDKRVEQEVLDFALDYEKELQMYQTRSMECDVLICILKIMLDQKEMELLKGKIRIQRVAQEYNGRFDDDFDDKERVHEGLHGAFVAFNHRVSPRKIGAVVSGKLMIRTERDGDGFFIPVSEYEKINILKGRYGITNDMLGIKQSNDKKAKSIEI